MPKAYVVVEGQTEETFVNQALAPHLAALGHSIIPIPQASQNYPRLKKLMRELLGDTTASLVTTMFDYYGLPKDFPGRRKPQGTQPIEKARFVEAQINGDIGHERFRAYLSLHEFEALLFSDPASIADALELPPKSRTRLTKIRDSFPTPEHIDDDPMKAPSKRLLQVYPGYIKTVDGIRIVNDIGLATIRGECPHFNDWLTLLEGIR